jgi:hypothetical protein
MLKRCLPFFLPALLVGGCTTTRITNLTPDKQFHTDNGFYLLEAALNSSQQSLRWDTVQPVAVVGGETFPMRPTRLMTNRWETLIPIPEGKNSVYYHFKFDYTYYSFPVPKADSKLSREFKLQIIPKQ